MNISIPDEIYIDFTKEKDLFIQTYGGKYKDNDVEFGDYSLGIGDLYIKLSPEQAVELCKKFTEHLRINGRIK